MKMSKIAKLSLVVSVISLLLLGNVAIGQVAQIPGIQPTGPTTVGGLVDVLRNVVRWIYILFFIIAVMFILFAAFSYLTAGGDPEQVSKAKSRIIYAAIAIAVALLAVGFEVIIRNFLQAGQ
jgi:hypothetical protein